MEEISADDALQRVCGYRPLNGFHVKGRFNITSIGDPMEDVVFPISISNCLVDEYYSPIVWYKASVEWTDCTFKKIEIDAVYFLKGLVCRDSEFLSPISWSAGGHNSTNTPILLERVKFHKFVDFFDCWFRGPVILRNVEFISGTNLLNYDHGWVNFEVPPVLENVRGVVDVNRNLVNRNGVLVLTERSPRYIYPQEKAERPRSGPTESQPNDA